MGNRNATCTTITAVMLPILLLCVARADMSKEASIEHIVRAIVKRDPEWDHAAACSIGERIVAHIEDNMLSLTDENMKEICSGISNLPNLSTISRTTHPITQRLTEERIVYIIENYYMAERSIKGEQERLYGQMCGLLDRIGVKLEQQYPTRLEVVTSIIADGKKSCWNMCFNQLRRDFKRPMTEDAERDVYSYWDQQFSQVADLSFDSQRDLTIAAAKINKVLFGGLFRIAGQTSLEAIS